MMGKIIKSRLFVLALGIAIGLLAPGRFSDSEVQQAKAREKELQKQVQQIKQEAEMKDSLYEKQIAALRQRADQEASNSELFEEKANVWQSKADRLQEEAQKVPELSQRLEVTEQALAARTNEAETLRASLEHEKKQVVWLSSVTIRQAEEIEAQKEYRWRLEALCKSYESQNADLVRLLEKKASAPKKTALLVGFLIGLGAGIAL